MEKRNESRGTAMSIRKQIGITSNHSDVLASDELKELASWRDLSSGEPYLIDPEMVDELASYLLDRAQPGPSTDRRYYQLRNALLMAARAYQTAEGRDLIVLNEATESSVRRRLEEFDREDISDLLSLGIPLANALAEVEGNGSVAKDYPAALEAWSEVANSLDELLSKPRRSTRFGLDDMLQSLDGLHALIEMLELYRRLLLAAGRALDDLGAATVDQYELPGLSSAVGMWRVAQGDSARRIGSTLYELAVHTEGFGVEEGPFEPVSADGSWILPYSRLGQQVTEWALEHSGSELNFATVGAAWPGPAVYGYDDGEEEPRSACELLAELARGGKGPRGILFGTDEVTVPEDLEVVVPPRFLGGDRTVYVAGQSDKHGGYLRCAGESRRMSLLAKLIADEQRLEGYAWGFAGDGEPADAPDDFSADFDEEFALLSIEGNLIELDEGGLLSLAATSLDGLEPGAILAIGGNGETFFIAESGQEERRNAWANGKDLLEICFGK